MDNHHVRYDQDLVTALDPLSHVSEAFKITRTNVEFSSIDQPARMIAFTSTNQSEGKTATIANLAITYAQIGRRVLLIDADLRRPAIHRMFGLSNRRGLTNALLSKSPYSEFVQPTQTENLNLLTSGPIPPNPAEILMSDTLGRIFEACRADYDLVLLDCPPVGVVTDGAIIATKVDGVVYIIRAGKVDRRQLQRATALLKQVKARVLGYILNGVSAETDDYYYAYYYQEYISDPDPRNKRNSKKGKQNRRQPPSSPRQATRQTPAGVPQVRRAELKLDDDATIPSLELDNQDHSFGKERSAAENGSLRKDPHVGLTSEDD